MAHEVNVPEIEVGRILVDDDLLVTEGSLTAIAARRYLGQKFHA
ncbi:hypothetical protein [Mycolicibacterium parafortuitum]